MILIYHSHCNIDIAHLEAKVGIEPALTALQAAALPLCHLAILRAGNGAQTRDLNLGKVALYQLSYSRNKTNLVYHPKRFLHNK